MPHIDYTFVADCTAAVLIIVILALIVGHAITVAMENYSAAQAAFSNEYRNYYSCGPCMSEWSKISSYDADSICPYCGGDVEPYNSLELINVKN